MKLKLGDQKRGRSCPLWSCKQYEWGSNDVHAWAAREITAGCTKEGEWKFAKGPIKWSTGLNCKRAAKEQQMGAWRGSDGARMRMGSWRAHAKLQDLLPGASCLCAGLCAITLFWVWGESMCCNGRVNHAGKEVLHENPHQKWFMSAMRRPKIMQMHTQELLFRTEEENPHLKWLTSVMQRPKIISNQYHKALKENTSWVCECYHPAVICDSRKKRCCCCGKFATALFLLLCTAGKGCQEKEENNNQDTMES